MRPDLKSYKLLYVNKGRKIYIKCMLYSTCNRPYYFPREIRNFSCLVDFLNTDISSFSFKVVGVCKALTADIYAIYLLWCLSLRVYLYMTHSVRSMSCQLYYWPVNHD